MVCDGISGGNIFRADSQYETTRTNFGGVVIDDAYVESKEYNKKTKKYIINFKDGTKIEYSKQKQSNQSSIYLETFEGGSDRLPVITNVSGAKITGSENRMDCIFLRGCNNCEVDVSNDKISDAVHFEDSGKYKSKNNTVILGEEDAAGLPNGKDIRGEYRKIAHGI